MRYILLLLCTTGSYVIAAAQHPALLFSSKELGELRSGIKKYPLLNQSFAKLKQDADHALMEGTIVPVPKDPAGGYTHGRHKQNYIDALDCGIVYNITADTSFAAYVRDMLLKYAQMYEGLPLHPARVKGHPAGKIFWQNLNDCVWQVYMIQAYDCIYNFLTPSQRTTIEQHLFYPIVNFLMVHNSEVFNKIHNHGTWSVAAVGITGYVLHKPEWVKMALHGSNEDNKTGFLAQINQLFSPDGYYTEGPYYERYALMPFMLFSLAIQKYQPDFHIFAYRDSVLIKAVQTSLQLTYNKRFFPVNDAIKNKTYITEELIYGADIAYAYGHHMDGLLSIAKSQGTILVSDIGLNVAKGISQGKAKPFDYKSGWYSDGRDGKEGGIGILRYHDKNNRFCALLKATALGMGHGHFDKLNLLVYDNGHEIIPDYGAARFINIATKEGGRYLPENNSWAKQTIAHNTVTVDETSDYNGNEKTGTDKHSYLIYYKEFSPEMQVLSCADTTAYPGVKLQRTLILAKPDDRKYPLLIDLYTVLSSKQHRYDLAYYYKGDIIANNFPVQRFLNKLVPYGRNNGYQYLWHTGQGKSDSTTAITFLNDDRFYTLTTAAHAAGQFDFVMTGSNDPDRNLLTQKGIVLSKENAADHVFLSVLDPHGKLDYASETTKGATSNVTDIKVLTASDQAIVFVLKTIKDTYQYTINFQDKNKFITVKKL